jgi:hypothetical protein
MASNINTNVAEVDHKESHWQPFIFNPAQAEDAAQLNQLIASGKVWRVFDTIQQQLADLIRTRHPRWVKEPVADSQVQMEIEHYLGSESLEKYGRWIYFPWSGTLVHLLTPDEFLSNGQLGLLLIIGKQTERKGQAMGQTALQKVKADAKIAELTWVRPVNEMAPTLFDDGRGESDEPDIPQSDG